MKKDFISLITEISQERIIQNNIEIILKHNKYSIKKLTINQLKVNDLNKCNLRLGYNFLGYSKKAFLRLIKLIKLDFWKISSFLKLSPLKVLQEF